MNVNNGAILTKFGCETNELCNSLLRRRRESDGGFFS